MVSLKKLLSLADQNKKKEDFKKRGFVFVFSLLRFAYKFILFFSSNFHKHLRFQMNSGFFL